MQHGRSPAWMRAAASTTLAMAALLTLPPASMVFAQNTAPPSPPPGAVAAPYMAVVTANAVNVRSGPSAQSAYVFGKLKAGDTVEVLAEDAGWARVRTAGPAFTGMTAYVAADRRVTVNGSVTSISESAPATAQVTARTEVRAVNADASGAPERSLRPIGMLEPGTTLTVQGVVNGERESVYVIALPDHAEGWVNLQFLRRGGEADATSHTMLPVNASNAGAPVITGSHQEDTPSAPAIPPIPEGTRFDSHGEGAVDGHAASAPATPRATWHDLEAHWQAVRQQPQATAELDALRAQYLALAQHAPQKSALAQMASMRAQQLELMMEAQTHAQALAALKNNQNERQQAMMQIVLDIQRRADYTAIGVLNASVVYDGKTLPQLYRITDPQTSQTIAYVLPNESIPMGTMLGTLVGVKGGKEFDSALNINVISPQVVELLTVRDTPQVTKVEQKTEQAAPASALAEKVPAPAPAADGTPFSGDAQEPTEDGDCPENE